LSRDGVEDASSYLFQAVGIKGNNEWWGRYSKVECGAGDLELSVWLALVAATDLAAGQWVEDPAAVVASGHTMKSAHPCKCPVSKVPLLLRWLLRMRRN